MIIYLSSSRVNNLAVASLISAGVAMIVLATIGCWVFLGLRIILRKMFGFFSLVPLTIFEFSGDMTVDPLVIMMPLVPLTPFVPWEVDMIDNRRVFDCNKTCEVSKQYLWKNPLCQYLFWDGMKKKMWSGMKVIRIGNWMEWTCNMYIWIYHPENCIRKLTWRIRNWKTKNDLSFQFFLISKEDCPI